MTTPYEAYMEIMGKEAARFKAPEIVAKLKGRQADPSKVQRIQSHAAAQNIRQNGIGMGNSNPPPGPTIGNVGKATKEYTPNKGGFMQTAMKAAPYVAGGAAVIGGAALGHHMLTRDNGQQKAASLDAAEAGRAAARAMFGY